MIIYKVMIIFLLQVILNPNLYPQESQSKISEYSSGYSLSSSGNQKVQIFSTVGMTIMGISSNSLVRVYSGREYLKDIFLEMGKIAGEIENEQILPKAFRLYENYPNPFNSSTTLKYEIPVQTYVDISLFDILGRKVQTIVSEEKPVGVFEIVFNASDLPSGIYFVRIKAGEFLKIGKMMLLK